MSFADVRKCGARTRIGGSYEQLGMANGRCRMHGGRTLRGLMNVNICTGRYSKAFPWCLQDRCDDAIRDKELLCLRKDIALVDSMLTFKLAELRGRLRPEKAGLGCRPTLGR